MPDDLTNLANSLRTQREGRQPVEQPKKQVLPFQLPQNIDAFSGGGTIQNVKPPQSDIDFSGVMQTLTTPGATLNKGVQQALEGDALTGALNVGLGIAHTIFMPVSLPFAAVGDISRSAGKVLGIEDVGEGIARAFEIPFEIPSQVVEGGQRLIDIGLESLGINTKQVDEGIIFDLQRRGLLSPNASPEELTETMTEINKLALTLVGLKGASKGVTALKGGKTVEKPFLETGKKLEVKTVKKFATKKEIAKLKTRNVKGQFEKKTDAKLPVKEPTKEVEKPQLKIIEQKTKPVKGLTQEKLPLDLAKGKLEVKDVGLDKLTDLPDANKVATDRMTKQGKTPEEISTALNIPKKEVKISEIKDEPVPNKTVENIKKAQEIVGKDEFTKIATELSKGKETLLKRTFTEELANDIVKEGKLPDKYIEQPKVEGIDKSLSNIERLKKEALGGKEPIELTKEQRFGEKKVKPVKERKFTEEDYKNDVLLIRQKPPTAFADPKVLKAYTRAGAYHLENIITSGIKKAVHYTEWSKSMLKEFGEKIKPHLLRIWSGIKKEFGKKLAQIVESPLNPARPLKMTDADFFKLDESSPTPKVVSRTPLDKLISGIESAASTRERTEFLRSIERSRRYGKLKGAIEKGEGIGGFFGALKSLKGEQPKGTFDPVKLSMKEQTSLFNEIRDFGFSSGYNTLGAWTGLAKILGRHKKSGSGGEIPTPIELGLLKDVFGEKLTDALMKKRTNWEKAKSLILEAINIPRVLMTFLDLSATFRQGLVLTVAHPKTSIPNIGQSFRYLFSEKAVKELEHNIAIRRNWDLYNKHKLEITKREGGGFDISKAEEEFMGAHFLEKVPILKHLIKGSQRAYVGYLNKMRVDIFDQLVDAYSRQGYKPRYSKVEQGKASKDATLRKKIIEDNRVYDGLAKFLNMASGRGSLGKVGNKIAPALNSIFFSPRNVASKLQLMNPIMYARMPKVVRMTMMKDMLTMIAANTTILALASQIAGVTVEPNPRSSDFAKIKIGNTRLDPWGGFQQVFRYFTQFALGERKSTRTGKISNIDPDTFPFDSRWDVLANFVQSKFSPQIGIIQEIVSGRDYFGNKIDFNKAVWEKDNPYIEKVSPLYIQDAIQAAQELGWGSVPAAIPGFFGVGLQTHEFKPSEKKKLKKKKTRKTKK